MSWVWQVCAACKAGGNRACSSCRNGTDSKNCTCSGFKCECKKVKKVKKPRRG